MLKIKFCLNKKQEKKKGFIKIPSGLQQKFPVLDTKANLMVDKDYSWLLRYLFNTPSQ